jgi:hypothetical protein
LQFEAFLHLRYGSWHETYAFRTCDPETYPALDALAGNLGSGVLFWVTKKTPTQPLTVLSNEMIDVIA